MGDDQVFGSAFLRSAMLFPGLRSSISQTASAKDETVVIAATERLVEEEVAGFLEPRERSDLVDAPLHVGMPSLPIFRPGPVFAQHRVGHEQAGRLHIGDKCGVRMLRREIARQHDADFVGKNLLAFIIDHAAAIAVAVEAERHISLHAQHLIAHGVQHLHVFGIGIVFRKGMVELTVEADNLATRRFEHLRRKCASGAVAACTHDLELALELRPIGEIGHVSCRKILYEDIGTAAAHVEACIEHDLLEPAASRRAQR